jgi:uncharacterized protein YydD (DUF2326 family)
MTSGNSFFDRLIEIRSQYWRDKIPVPKSLIAQIDQASKDQRASEKRAAELHELEQKRANEEEQTAKELYKQLRTELGLPPPPPAQ